MQIEKGKRESFIISGYLIICASVILLIGWLLNRPFYWMWSSSMEEILPDFLLFGMEVRIYTLGLLLGLMVLVSSCILLGGLVVLLRRKNSSKARKSVERIFVVSALVFQLGAIFLPWLFSRLGPHALIPLMLPHYRWNGWFFPYQLVDFTNHGVYVSSFQDYWFGNHLSTNLGWLGVFILQISTVLVATIGSVIPRLREKAVHILGAGIGSLGTVLLGAYQYRAWMLSSAVLNESIRVEPSIGFIPATITTVLFFGAFLNRETLSQPHRALIDATSIEQNQAETLSTEESAKKRTPNQC